MQEISSSKLPAICSVGTGALSLGGKATWTLPSSRVEVKNKWSYASSSPVCLHDVDRENLTFL
jgi:hypothetical protein